MLFTDEIRKDPEGILKDVERYKDNVCFSETPPSLKALKKLRERAMAGDKEAIDMLFKVGCIAIMQNLLKRIFVFARGARDGRKGGKKPRIETNILHDDWCITAAKKRKINSRLSDQEIAGKIRESQKECGDRVYSVDHIRKIIKK